MPTFKSLQLTALFDVALSLQAFGDNDMGQIRQLIELNRIDRDEGDLAYSFVYDNKVKKINVTAALQNQLSRGRLAIVRLLKNNQP